MRSTIPFLLAVALAAAGCGGSSAAGGKVRKLVKVKTPKTINHLDRVFEVVESPPADVHAAWGKLGPAQGKRVADVFYPAWTAERQAPAMEAAWREWSRRWPDLRTGLYRMENRFAGSVAPAARAFARSMGSSPQATVHLALVPDPRAGAAGVVDGKGVIVLNAGPLALLPEDALEREVVRQLAALTVLQRLQVPPPPPLSVGLFLDGLGAWAVRHVRPHSQEPEVMSCTAERLTTAQSKLREVEARLAVALAATDPPTVDRWLVHGDGDRTLLVTSRLAAYKVVRELARDHLPAEVLALSLDTFSQRASSFWSSTGAPSAGGALVETRSAAEEARIARGGKTADCLGPYTEEGERVALELPGGRWGRQGARLEGELTASSVTLGLLADVKRADPDTLDNLRYFFGEFSKAGVTAVLVPGDVAETTAGIRDSLAVFGSVDVPVLIIPGNRESQSKYRRAMDEALQKYGNLIDMTRVRLVDTNRFSVVSLPGYYDPRYTHAKDGCLYDPEDVAALGAVVAKANGRPRILMAHSPPKASGKNAIDWADAGANVGDPAMTKLLNGGSFEAGVYANLHETGGRAARGNLKTRVRPGKWVKDIHLVTGASSAMPWPMLDGRVSTGMAGLLDIKGGKLRYRILRVKDK